MAAIPGHGQVPDPGMAGQQDPGIAQDTEAAREKLLKAADELDMIQGNSEANKMAIDGMKNDIARLQADNADLKQQIAALQAALEKSETERAKERAAIVEEVATLVADKTGDGGRPAAKHHETADDGAADAPAPSTEVHSSIKNQVAETEPVSAEQPAPDDTSSTSAETTPAPAPKPKPQKGYYHVVESGETLAMICSAYRDEGVKVTMAQVRKANGLTTKSVLKPGQKIFIPKPIQE